METTDIAIDMPSRNDEEVVVVTLVSRPHGSEISTVPRRQFTLSTRAPAVRIGRASKVPTKGFVASCDNAWFDSPVMSRQHAELFLGYENDGSKAVFIRDIGSLHGTYYTPYDGIRFGNESRLEQGKPVKLSNGDTLRFGVDIFRTSETFPPCSVEFYSMGQEQEQEQEQEQHSLAIPGIDQSTNRVFTVPDDDDDDDEDDDSIIETTIPSLHKPEVHRGPSIDLTQDEADSVDGHHYPSSATTRNVVKSDVIDLTSEPGENADTIPESISETTRSRRHSSASLPETVQSIPALTTVLTTCKSDMPAEADNSQEPIRFGSEPNRSSAQDRQLHEHDEEKSREDIQLTDLENESVVTRDSIDDISDDGEDMDEDEDEDEDEDGDGDEEEDEDIEDLDNLLLGHISEEEEDISIGYRFKNGCVGSDSENEDDRSLELFSYSDTSSSSGEVADTHSNSSSPAPESSLYSSPNPPISKGETYKDASPEGSSPKRSFVTPFLFTAPSQHSPPVAQPRDPSPSDAAMFKSCPVLDRAPSDSRAQALGEKSGKYEFFAARESNRTNLMEFSLPPTSAIRETLGGNSNDHVADDEANCNLNPEAPPVQVDSAQMKPTEEVADVANNASKDSHSVHSDSQAAAQDSASLAHPTWDPWSASGERFINNPRCEDIPCTFFERLQSPDFDMTSAYAYQLSKAATESNIRPKPRRVGIEDLLTREPSSVPLHDNHVAASIPAYAPQAPLDGEIPCEASLKRTFEDAFSDENALGGPDDVHRHSVDKSNPESTNKKEGSSVPKDESGGVAIPKDPLQQREAEVEPVTISARPDNFQPSKRRRFAQAAACVALGGAAAFTFMVSTAPVL